MKLELGQKVSYQRCFIKSNRNAATSFVALPLEGNGIIVGIRYMPVGHTKYGFYDEDAPEFKRTGTEKFVLVTNSLHRKPRLVKEEDLSLLDSTPIPSAMGKRAEREG